jgi:C4-dicarboxylate transporter DctM subunit
VAIYIYKEITYRDLPHIIIRSAKMAGIILFLTGMSTLFAWIVAREQIPDQLMSWIIGFSSSPWVFLMLSNIILVFMGAVLEGAPAIIILAPLLMPVALKLGLDPIHYGTVMIANIGLGYFVPPVGICLLVACSVGKVDVGRMIKPVMPFFLVMVLGLLIITYIPGISLFLPKLLGYQPIGHF